MVQTLLAIGSLAIASLLMLSTAQHEMRQRDAVSRTEIERAAANVAVDVLGTVSRQAFDGRIESGGEVHHEGDLAAYPFNTGRDCFEADGSLKRDSNDDLNCGDVDDVHRMRTATILVDYAVAEDDDGDALDEDLGGQLPITVDASVRYVDESGAFSGSKTYQKEVRVAAWHPLLADSVRITQVVAY